MVIDAALRKLSGGACQVIAPGQSVGGVILAMDVVMLKDKGLILVARVLWWFRGAVWWRGGGGGLCGSSGRR